MPRRVAAARARGGDLVLEAHVVGRLVALVVGAARLHLSLEEAAELALLAWWEKKRDGAADA